MTFSDYNFHTIDLLTTLKMLKVQDVFALSKFIFTFYYIKCCISDELKRLFIFNYDIHSCITHSSEAFHIPKRNTTRFCVNNLSFDALNYGASFNLNC